MSKLLETVRSFMEEVRGLDTEAQDGDTADASPGGGGDDSSAAGRTDGSAAGGGGSDTHAVAQDGRDADGSDTVDADTADTVDSRLEALLELLDDAGYDAAYADGQWAFKRKRMTPAQPRRAPQKSEAALQQESLERLQRVTGLSYG